jgi:hypothetical protein
VFDKYSTAVWVSDQNFDSASWGSGQRLFADDYHPNADTLTTARTINGVSFNGSANITITADPNAHTHAIADVTGLQDALNDKVAKAGDTMSGTLTINNSDSSALNATSSGDRTAGFTAASVNNLTTSSTNNITKTGLRVSSLNAWSGTNTTNRALFLQATGATTNRAIEVESGTSVLQDMTATTAAFSGNILLTGPVTTTNQARTIDFTGFDKEGTTDFSDRAYIQHTINTGGHAGSVLVISSQNDADDGIAFLTNASSQIRHNGHVMWDAGNDGATSGLDADLLDGQHASAFALSAHSHGNITNAGAIGTTASLPIITTTSGVLTTGSFGTTAGTFAQGNDSRLSDARTPLSHTHGNITNAGAIGTTADLVAVTTTSGVLTTASRSGIDSRTAFPTTYANITGTVPTWNQSTTGNAATATNAEYANIAGYATDSDIANSATIATTLATARTLTIGNTGKTFNGSANVSWTLSEIGATNNTGDVVGPASSVNARIATFNGTTGKLIQDSGTLISGLATSSHQHGYLTSSGVFGGSPSIVASSDRLVITDASDTSKMNYSSIAFGTSTTQFLTNAGTWTQPMFGAYSQTSFTTNTTTAAVQVFAITNITPGTYQFMMQGGWGRSSGGTARRFQGGLSWNNTSNIHQSLTSIVQFGSSSTTQIIGSMNAVGTFAFATTFVTDESTAFVNSGRFTVQGMIQITGSSNKTLFFNIGQTVAQTSATCSCTTPSISLIRVI